jgi:hypothetical protein
LPSSHYSPFTKIPSPQIDKQIKLFSWKPTIQTQVPLEANTKLSKVEQKVQVDIFLLIATTEEQPIPS